MADALQVSGAAFAGDMTAGDVKALRKLLPSQNLFYLRSLFDQVEKAAGEAVGVD